MPAHHFQELQVSCAELRVCCTAGPQNIGTISIRQVLHGIPLEHDCCNMNPDFALQAQLALRVILNLIPCITVRIKRIQPFTTFPAGSLQFGQCGILCHNLAVLDTYDIFSIQCEQAIPSRNITGKHRHAVALCIIPLGVHSGIHTHTVPDFMSCHILQFLCSAGYFVAVILPLGIIAKTRFNRVENNRHIYAVINSG